MRERERNKIMDWERAGCLVYADKIREVSVVLAEEGIRNESVYVSVHRRERDT